MLDSFVPKIVHIVCLISLIGIAYVRPSKSFCLAGL
jgi:hypothetical protein